MKQNFPNYDALKAFIEPLIAQDKYAIDVQPLPDGVGYAVQWEEGKYCRSMEGVAVRDEVWITKEGEMKFIQDLEPEHAKNIIRLLLRQEREAVTRAAEELLEMMTDELDGIEDAADALDECLIEPPTRTLH